MMRFLAQLWRCWQLVRRTDLAETETFWRDADARALQAFLDGDSGRRFTSALRRVVFTDTAGAVMQGGNVSWRCGHAAGMQSLAAHVDLLARWTGETAATSTARDARPADNLTWLHGTPNEQASPEG